MADKNKNSNQAKVIPKDAQVIVSIMKDMGITDYDPKVINQLLEFSYRYVSTILDDSKTFAAHSKKKNIDLDDVCVAVRMQCEKSYTNPPPREVMVDLAEVKNNMPLPQVKPNCGLRLPPDRYLLNKSNLKFKSPKKNIQKTNDSENASNINLSNNLVVKRPGTVSNFTRPQIISMPRPVFKVDSNHANSVEPHTQINPNMPLTPQLGPVILPIIKSETGESNKRKREDDDYDVC